MNKIIQFFINRPVWGNAGIVIVLMFGLFTVLNMKKSFFPELEPKTIFVSVTFPGASPTEMELGITIKIEQAVKGLDGIDEINSTSTENFTQVAITANEDTDIDELLSDVENTVSSISGFPKSIEPPIVTKQKTGGMGSVVAFVGISARNTNGDITNLTDMASQVENELLNSKEITQIKKTGFPDKEISIEMREQDLLRYNISMQEVSSAISSKNVDITTGIIRGTMEDLNIRSNNRSSDPNKIKTIVVRTTPAGDNITVGDVANVKLTYSEGSQQAKFNGKPAVSFQIEKTMDQDISKITDALYDYRDKFNKNNPEYEFNIFYEFNSLLDDRIDLLTRNGIMGLILVLLFLGLFLNLKLSAWVAFGIPFSFLGMFILGAAYGITINMISLFGMILVVGILVDDGIVIAENIYTHFEKGKPAHKAALDGTMEVIKPVFSSVLTTIVAFSMLLFIEGMEMMREMAFVVIACLLFSLFEAFIILPSHLGHKTVLSEKKSSNVSYFLGSGLMVSGLIVIYVATGLISETNSYGLLLLPFTLIVLGATLFIAGFIKSPMENKVREGADRMIKYIRDHWFKSAVENIVGSKRKWFYFTFFIPMFFTITAFILVGNGVIGATFFPNIEPDFFTIETAYKPGESKTKTEKFINRATQILIEENNRIINETGDTLLTYYSSNVGASMNIGQSGNHTGMVQVFYNGEGKNTPVDTLMNRIIRRINSSEEGQLAENTYVGGFNRFGKEIAIGLTAQKENDLLRAKNELKQRMGEIEGVINIKDNMPPGKNEVDIKIRPEAEIYGLTESSILAQIRGGFFGTESQRVIVETDEIKIWVRFPLEDRNSLFDLKNMKIKTPQGTAIPLKNICDFNMSRAPETLKRLDGQRIITVDAECTDPDQVAKINTKIEESILEDMFKSYPNLSSVEQGQSKRQKKAQASMSGIVPIGLVIMFIIITLHFNSLSSAFLIMLVIPSGIAGAIIGHGLIGIPVSILSMFGIVALIGVLVNDAIVYLDRYNELLKQGQDVTTAAKGAAVSRFRPILLTSLTTVAGLLPIILETSMQAQFLIPVAVSIAFGVLFGTVFILVFYPSAILFWNRGRVAWRIIIHGEKIEEFSSVEPALKFEKNQHEFETK